MKHALSLLLAILCLDVSLLDAALKDPIRIECSTQFRYVLDGLPDDAVHEGPPLVLIVDPNSKTLLNADGSPAGKVETFTDEEIVAVGEGEKGTWRIRIDRVFANYRRTVRLKISPDEVIDISQWGKCVRVAPGKKF